MEQWEYKVLYIEPKDNFRSDLKEFQENLNELGQEGWEVAGVMSHDISHAKLILKRRKQG